MTSFSRRFGILVACAALAGAEDRTYRILDPTAVRADGDPSIAVVTVKRPSRIAQMRCDLVVAGGGMGGVAAALAGAQGGLRVCLTEVTDWLGGQMTSQGVSALDENRWIETSGATRSYQDLRRRIRAHYAQLLAGSQRPERLNPGQCWVSALCFEPKVGVSVLNELIRPFEKSGKLVVLRRTTAVEATRAGEKLSSILVYGFAAHRFTELSAPVFIDATELGELLPLAHAGFRVGAEARSETGERDGPETADPQALQSFTYPFVLERRTMRAAENSAAPATYNRDKAQFTFFVSHNQLRYAMFEKLPGTPGSFWTYRRLIAADQFAPGRFAGDLSMINWPGNDACDASYMSGDALIAARALQHGKQVAIGFAWWLQHDAPRDSGTGAGFPEIVLRRDVLGSTDGLSLYPYIRESRRMTALRIVREQDVAEPWQPGVRGAAFEDTAGIGFYPIDIHGCGTHTALPRSKPYQIPYGALISSDVSNLLAGAKDLGATHITNGAYRLHPTEWAIGEASGMLAVAAVNQHRDPVQVYRDRQALRALQERLLEAGHPLVWFDDVTPEDAAFRFVQLAAVRGLMPPDEGSLHFRPGENVTEAEAEFAKRKLGVAGTSPALSRASFAQWLLTPHGSR